MSAFYDLASVVLVPSGYKSGKIYAQKPLTTDGQLTFTRASTATRVNASGALETVASGVPRLDYTNSSCPKLLLEPQRTNVVPFSEQIDNAAWVKQNITISPNTQTAPDGTLSADKVIVANGVAFSTTSNYCRTAALTLTTGVVHTVSVYAKADGFNRMAVRMSTATTMGAGPTVSITVDLITGLQTGGTIGTYIGRTPAANGYFRYSFQTTSIASATNYLSFVPSDSTATEGNGVDGISIFGAQLEAGAYPTSYVKTEAAAVTRLMDQCEKTATFSNVKHNDCTLFYDFEHLGNLTVGQNQFVVLFGSGKYLNLAQYDSSIFYVDTDINGSYFFTTAVNTTLGRKKVAIKIDGLSWKIFFNGVKVHEATLTQQSTASLSEINLGGRFGTVPAYHAINQVLALPALTDSQCIELTTL
jgi:hypothetical protein